MDWDSLMDCQGAQSQKEGQRDQGGGTKLGGFSPQLFSGPLVLLAFLVGLGSLAIPQAIPKSIKLSPVLKPALGTILGLWSHLRT